MAETANGALRGKARCVKSGSAEAAGDEQEFQQVLPMFPV